MRLLSRQRQGEGAVRGGAQQEPEALEEINASFTYIYIYIYICTYAYTYTYLCLSLSLSIYIYIYILYIYDIICKHVYVYTYNDVFLMFLCLTTFFYIRRLARRRSTPLFGGFGSCSLPISTSLPLYPSIPPSLSLSLYLSI